MSIISDILTFLGIAKVNGKSFDVFRSAPYTDPFVTGTDVTKPEGKLQKKLDDAITALATSNSDTLANFPIPFTIADVSSATGPFPAAHHDPDVIDFIASEDKIAAMYAAFELRGMVQRFAKVATLTVTATTSEADILNQLIAQLEKLVNPTISSVVPRVKPKDVNGDANNYKDAHGIPKYRQAIKVTKTGSTTFTVDFADDYLKAVTQMIVNSGDDNAGYCIQGIGYKFLNGALEAGGFFHDDSNSAKVTGLWLAGDYVMLPKKKPDGTEFDGERENFPYLKGIRPYPKVRGVDSRNDKASAQAGTTRAAAKLFALIKSGAFQSTSNAADNIDPAKQMNDLLKGAVTGAFLPIFSAPTYTASGLVLPGNFLMNKLGWAPLGRPWEKGKNWVASQASLISDVSQAGKSYVVVWQNLELDSKAQKVKKYEEKDVRDLILKTIKGYETP